MKNEDEKKEKEITEKISKNGKEQIKEKIEGKREEIQKKKEKRRKKKKERRKINISVKAVYAMEFDNNIQIM